MYKKAKDLEKFLLFYINGALQIYSLLKSFILRFDFKTTKIKTQKWKRFISTNK